MINIDRSMAWIPCALAINLHTTIRYLLEHISESWITFESLLDRSMVWVTNAMGLAPPRQL